MSSRFLNKFGNGKTHRTPLPEGLKRIKIIRFETFLKLKELFKNFKQQYIVQPKPYRKSKPKIRKNIIKQNHRRVYEPSNISYAYDSLFWRWRRVAEWQHYINDPYDNIKK